MGRKEDVNGRREFEVGRAGNKAHNWAIVEGPRLGDTYLASVTDEELRQ